MKYEITSKYGWVPGLREPRRLSDGTMEQPMLLLHVPGRLSPVEVVSGPAAFTVSEYLALAGAIPCSYNGPGSKPLEVRVARKAFKLGLELNSEEVASWPQDVRDALAGANIL